MLKLNLITKRLEDDEGKLFFPFEKYTFDPRFEKTSGRFELDNMLISKDIIDDIIFEKEKETLSFEATYNGEGYFSDIFITSQTNLNEKLLIKQLDLFLDIYIYKNPLEGNSGDIKGEVETYYDYNQEEFIFTLNKIVLEEN